MDKSSIASPSPTIYLWFRRSLYPSMLSHVPSICPDDGLNYVVVWNVGFKNNTRGSLFTNCFRVIMNSLISTVQSLHGRDMASTLVIFENLRLRRSSLVTDLEFLKHCRNNNIIPCFARCNHMLLNPKNKAMFDRLNLSLVRNEIKIVHDSLVKIVECCWDYIYTSPHHCESTYG